MRLLKLLKYANKKFYVRGLLQEPQHFQNEEFHAKMQPTRGWMLYGYA